MIVTATVMVLPRTSASSDPVATAFRAKTDAVSPSIWRCLRRFGVPDPDLDDAFQSVLLQLHERWDRLSLLETRELRNYSCVVAIGVARRQAGKRRRYEHSSVPLTDEIAGHDDPEGSAARRQALARLDAILAEMPIELREVFILYELEGLTGAEIAASLDIPSGTVASRLRRARSDFKSAVARKHVIEEDDL